MVLYEKFELDSGLHQIYATHSTGVLNLLNKIEMILHHCMCQYL